MLGQFARVLSPISGFLACQGRQLAAKLLYIRIATLPRLALTPLLSLLLALLLLLLLLEPALWNLK
jgi:hypothetical protein